MKVLLVGATGIIGRMLYAELKKDEKLSVITVSRTGDTAIHADISDAAQIKDMYKKQGGLMPLFVLRVPVILELLIHSTKNNCM
jgi:dTDP-4-dehydrorhamnose reductase